MPQPCILVAGPLDTCLGCDVAGGPVRCSGAVPVGFQEEVHDLRVCYSSYQILCEGGGYWGKLRAQPDKTNYFKKRIDNYSTSEQTQASPSLI